MKSAASKTARHPLHNGEPPEYPGFEKAIPEILRGLWEVKQLLAETQMTATLKTYSAAEIAQCFGVSYLHLRHNPWTLPNYGRPDIGLKPGRWLFTTVMEWYEIPEDERRRRWEAMSSTERRVAMGAIPGDRRRKNAGGEEEKEA
jgi:hypothetical protein